MRLSALRLALSRLVERACATSGFETAVHALAQKKLERLNEKTGRGEYVPASEYVIDEFEGEEAWH